MDITPDLIPCELAVICKKPCWEVSFPLRVQIASLNQIDNNSISFGQVFVQRTSVYQDDVIREDVRSLEPAGILRNLVFKKVTS